MSEPETEAGTVWDAPNQQVVLAGVGPWEEGTGGEPGEPIAPPPPEEPPGVEQQQATADYEEMTKDELINLCRERGISPANADMSKAQLIDALRAAD